MYIESSPENKNREAEDEKINAFFSEKEETHGNPREQLESPHNFLISEHSRDVLMHWQAPEFETFERDRKWYLYITLALAAIVSYAVYTNSPLMAITFILIGVVGYIYINKDPRTLDFMITKDGIVAGREIYEYDNLESFWIFYEPENIKVISLNTKSHLVPYVHIPVHDENPTKIREILSDHIPEEKQEPGLVETLERLLRI